MARALVYSTRVSSRARARSQSRTYAFGFRIRGTLRAERRRVDQTCLMKAELGGITLGGAITVLAI
jgi:hypothetical protein